MSCFAAADVSFSRPNSRPAPAAPFFFHGRVDVLTRRLPSAPVRFNGPTGPILEPTLALLYSFGPRPRKQTVKDALAHGLLTLNPRGFAGREKMYPLMIHVCGRYLINLITTAKKFSLATAHVNPHANFGIRRSTHRIPPAEIRDSDEGSDDSRRFTPTGDSAKPEADTCAPLGVR